MVTSQERVKERKRKRKVDISLKMKKDGGCVGEWLNSCKMFTKQARRPAFDLRILCLTSKSREGLGK